jgi:oligosaccharide repeat unit polymerase
MELNVTYIIFYTSLFWVLSIFYLFKDKGKIKIRTFILLIYAISSSSTIYYIDKTPQQVGSIHPEALFYLFTALIICISPFLKFDETKIIQIKSGRNHNLIVNLSLFLLPFLYLALLEITIISININASSLVNIYDNLEDSLNVTNKLSWLGGKAMIIADFSQPLLPILFFYLLQFKNKYTFIKVSLLLGMLLFVLKGYANAQRVAMVSTFLYFFFVYMLFKPALNDAVKRRINGIGTVLVSLLAVLIIYTTIARFSDVEDSYEGFDIWTWVSLYSGEAPLRFSETMWDDMRVTSNGDTSFALFKSALGFETFDTLYDRREYWEPRQGIPINVFYTFVGDWYCDFGPYGAYIVCIIFYLLLKSLLPSKKVNTIYLDQIIIIAILGKILIMGFTFYTYCNPQGQLVLMPAIVLSIFFYIKRKFIWI